MKTKEFNSEQYIKMATSSLNKGAWRRALSYLQNAQKIKPGPLD
jgi:hypothetical protein